MASHRALISTCLLALALATSGCATKFVAKPVNPLRPAQTAGWEPGELSPATQARVKALPAEPAAAIAALDPLAARDPAARRAVIELALAAGMQAHAKFLTDRGAAGLYLCAAEHAFDARTQGGADFQRFAREASRYALARLAGLREVAIKNGVPLDAEIVGPTRSYRVAWRTDAPGAVRVEQFSALVATDRYRVVGARELALVEGAGTPLIGKVNGPVGKAAAEAVTMEDGLWVPLTATVEFGAPGPVRTATFAIYDRKRVESAMIGGRRETLAGDFSTPFAVRTRELDQQSFLTLGILGFLRGDRWFEYTGLYPLETPTTDKIPVVFVHGLLSDPNDWRFLHNAMLADPQIRENYQFWAFYYPTSMAVPWSATRLRQGLAHARERLNPGGQNPRLGRMIVLGHSMGGLLTRMQIVSGGDAIYHRYFKKPPEQLRLSASERAMVRDMFFFEPNPDIDETVFICTPHQGSLLASNWIGKIGRMIARLPLTIIETTANIVTLNADALTADVQLQPGTSIDSLSPGGKFASIVQELPMSPRVKKYSIIGDRDKVVPYWSSHIEGVPETIIPSGHSGPEHEQCAAKVRELLRKHAAR
ncbi:MAG: hypothetical protein ABMA13_12720 [Chthoniobacteraceae bacterium]